jgi:hypothetical protein
MHVPFSLSRIVMSGLLLGMVLSVCTCWFHNMVILPPWLVSAYFGTCSYQSFLSNFTPVSLHMLKCSCALIIIIIIIVIVVTIIIISQWLSPFNQRCTAPLSLQVSDCSNFIMLVFPVKLFIFTASIEGLFGITFRYFIAFQWQFQGPQWLMG